MVHILLLKMIICCLGSNTKHKFCVFKWGSSDDGDNFLDIDDYRDSYQAECVA